MVDAHQERRGAEGRDHVHGAGVAARRGRPASTPSCATGPTPTRVSQKTPEGQGQVRGRAVPGVRGRRQGAASSAATTPSSRSTRRTRAAALKFVDYLTSRGAPDARRDRVRRWPPVLDGDLRRPGGQEGAAVRGRAQAGDRAGQGAPGLAGLPADLAGDLQERQRGALGPHVAGGGAEAGAGATSRRPWRPSRPWLKPPPSRRAHASGGAPAGSRSAASRSCMVSPSMLLIALVAAYPIIYAIWLSLHEYSVRVAGLSRWAGLRQLHRGAVEPGLLGRVEHDVHLHRRVSVSLELLHRPRHGAGDARGVQGPGRSCARSSSCRGRS